MSGNENNSMYPMQWSEGGRDFYYDGDIEHSTCQSSYAHPPRIVYVAADMAQEEFERMKAIWDRYGFAVERKCP